MQSSQAETTSIAANFKTEPLHSARNSETIRHLPSIGDTMGYRYLLARMGAAAERGQISNLPGRMKSCRTQYEIALNSNWTYFGDVTRNLSN